MPVKEKKSRRLKPAVPVKPLVPERPATLPLLVFLERHSLKIFFALLAVGTLRIVSTYHVFSHTWDEPVHIATGVEYLSKGTYQFDQEHPPLTRLAVGLGPYLTGIRPLKPGDMFAVADKLIYANHHYEETLTAARMGTLPFFWAACLVVYLWSKRYCGRTAAVLAVFLFSFFPLVLAHSGLATTDMGCTATLGAAFLAGCVFLESPSWRRAIVFGLCGGLAILAKFSALAYFPASAAVALVWYWVAERPSFRQLFEAGKKLAGPLAMAAAVAALVAWAGYLFSFAHGVPAPELWSGIGVVTRHNSRGHWAYLLGQIKQYGFWDFFPVAMGVKTPIPFLLLAGAGVWLAIRGRGGKRLWLPLAYSVGILAVGMTGNINIGLRHVLPMFCGLAVLAGAAAAEALKGSRRTMLICAALLVWMAAASLLAHPDYLAYFNLLARSQPENFLVDSDLDWGQDVSRLGRRLHELGVQEVSFVPADPIDIRQQPGFEGIKVRDYMSWALPNDGWNAVELTGLKQRRLGFVDTHPELTLWPNVVPPMERVGKSILLWYFPPGGKTPTMDSLSKSRQ